MVKLRELQYFIAVAEQRHFGRAANQCHVSQPTLSSQLQKLESQLGLSLFERQHHRVLLTPAGEQLLPQARQVINAASDFGALARELNDPLAGELHLGLIPTLAPYLLPEIVEPLQQALPRVELFLHEQQTRVLLAQLREGKLDALILPWLDEMEGLERYDLFDEPLVLMSPADHPLATKAELHLDDLGGQEVLALEDGHCLRDQAMGYCFAAGAAENDTFRATSLETLRHMVASGRGITLMPALSVPLQPDPKACYRHFVEPQPFRTISLVIRPGYTRMAAIRAVVQQIRQQCSAG